MVPSGFSGAFGFRVSSVILGFRGPPGFSGLRGPAGCHLVVLGPLRGENAQKCPASLSLTISVAFCFVLQLAVPAIRGSFASRGTKTSHAKNISKCGRGAEKLATLPIKKKTE